MTEEQAGLKAMISIHTSSQYSRFLRGSPQHRSGQSHKAEVIPNGMPAPECIKAEQEISRAVASTRACGKDPAIRAGKDLAGYQHSVTTMPVHDIAGSHVVIAAPLE